MTNNEKLFLLLGWRNKFYSSILIPEEYEWADTERKFYKKLPNVSNDYELCREYVIPEMRKSGFDWYVLSHPHWFFWKENGLGKGATEIIDDNIAAALVDAAIKVLENEDS